MKKDVYMASGVNILRRLIGEGQEIYLEEESGMSLWAEAMEAPSQLRLKKFRHYSAGLYFVDRELPVGDSAHGRPLQQKALPG